MKHIKKLYEFLILENNEESLFKNEKELKDLLLKDEDFAAGEILQGLINIFHEFWTQYMSYHDIVNLINKKFGKLAALALLLAKYNSQVGNGGHLQYYDNGFASTNSKGFGYTHDNIDIHYYFVNLFKELEMDEILTKGKEAYEIIDSFELNLNDDIEQCHICGGDGRITCYSCNGDGSKECDYCNGEGEIDEETCDYCGGDGAIECEDCSGNGSIECDNCDGKGEYESGTVKPETDFWEKLDSRWYEIDVNIITDFENYIKRQTLDGDIIMNLVPIAKSTQQYNL